MELWQRFTERARRAILAAHETAKDARCTEISTDHVLIGLLRLPHCGAAAMLERLDVDRETVLEVLRAEVATCEDPPPDEVQFAIPAQHILQEAYAISKERRDYFVTTEHLLAALLNDKDGEWPQLVEKIGTDAEAGWEAFVAVRDAGEGDTTS